LKSKNQTIRIFFYKKLKSFNRLENFEIVLLEKVSPWLDIITIK